MKIYWLMIVLVFIPTARSAYVTITPEDIAVEFGTDSVNFTCTVQLEMIEATSEHWIIWWKDYIKLIVDNDAVLVNPDKYSVYGVSSAASTHYTQILQIHDIDAEDNGTYSCAIKFTLYPSTGISEPSISSQATRLSITYLSIPEPTCFNETTTGYEKHQPRRTLYCSCPSSYSQTMLQWFDNEGNELNTQPQFVENGKIFLTYSFSPEIDTNNKWFTCRATRIGIMGTKECVIGTNNSASDNSLEVTIRSTNGVNIQVDKTKTSDTSLPVTTQTLTVVNNFDNNNKSVTIVMLSVIVTISVLINVAFTIYIFILRKEKRYEKNVDTKMEPYYVNNQNNQQLSQPQPVVNEDGYMEPIGVTVQTYEQINTINM